MSTYQRLARLLVLALLVIAIAGSIQLAAWAAIAILVWLVASSSSDPRRLPVEPPEPREGDGGEGKGSSRGGEVRFVVWFGFEMWLDSSAPDKHDREAPK